MGLAVREDDSEATVHAGGRKFSNVGKPSLEYEAIAATKHEKVRFEGNGAVLAPAKEANALTNGAVGDNGVEYVATAGPTAIPLSTDDQCSTDAGTEYDDESTTVVSEMDGSEVGSVSGLRVHDESRPAEQNGGFRIEQMQSNGHESEDAFQSDEEDDGSDEGSDEEGEGEGAEKWAFPDSKLPDEDRNYGVDGRDVGTSDSWVKRHPDLIRLTGRHPFNCEAPLPKLMAQGFLTPTSLHYVRNHGYVPHGAWDDWSIDVSGEVRRPMKLTMNDLMTKFRYRELPVTLVCAGNRRMEQNLTAKTIGFNWGCAAVSTSVWKGVLLRDVLDYCGILSKKRGAAFVCFEGAETLPAGGGTKYGTSLTIETAMDEGRDVLVAFYQNGKVLDPDHGYPVRMIIPGHIGGRMVKWLKKIEVTPSESFNYYHFNDNRVLPSHVNAEMAKAEGWWYKPDYIINELNINSAITSPAHDDVLPFASTQAPYTVRGYAYTGGGRKVMRVELTLDGGATWRLCEVTYNEKPTAFGKYWCWVFWHLEVDVTDFLLSKEIAVRAWDASMNTQPEHLTWNVMGMMNNCWFRVKVEACKTNGGGVGLHFQHPTLPGKQPGGWMHAEKEKAAKAVVLESATAGINGAKMPRSASTPLLAAKDERQIPMSEVRQHTDSQSAWVVVHGVVYDCTPFLKDHPGGADSILLTAGTDATEEFDGIHSEKAKAMLASYRVGILVPETEAAAPSGHTPESSLRGGNNFAHLASIPESSGPPVTLNPRERVSLTVIEREILSQDVRKLRFALPSKDHILGLPVGKHVLIAAKVGEKLVMRAYTPTSCDKDVGYFDLLFKVYFKTEHFPAGGLMSQHLDSLRVGHTIGIKGPLGHIHYQGRGKLEVDGELKFVKKFAMIAGGTGVTPMYQIIRAVLEDPEDTTEISLIYSNRFESDIMTKPQLDDWYKNHSNFKVWYTLSGKPPDGWTHGIGRITELMMHEHLPAGGSPNVFACLCGPSRMEEMCMKMFDKMGFEKDHCLRF